MASKRAFQVLPLRTSSTVLRSRCSISRQIFKQPRATYNYVESAQVRIAGVQQRWHSAGIPEDKKSRMYEFEDIVAIVENPKDTAVLIDVREPSEYLSNAIPTSLNIPITSQPDALLLPSDEFEDRFGFQKPSVTKEVVFYCKAGVRSAAAAQIAKQAGYEKVGEYRGSWLDWERKGGVGTREGPKETG
ncbi:Rhodanese-like protein [Lindgomyces ingoldianus]|uniref:Rhodanese-like protein n=1 Tax=Lindgomyces ingoldianus TaxID=673940 RepID=A0ACB6R0W8_9PLEO|nr:Rhodanese-like protein [Lindgomyces ingoldianus]KAF2472923.1 Rhodanese-like protein [Lindgomyces ingoldianus]